MDDRLLAAFGYRQPSRWERAAASGALRLRAAIVRFLPPRKVPLYPGSVAASAATRAAMTWPNWEHSRTAAPCRWPSATGLTSHRAHRGGFRHPASALTRSPGTGQAAGQQPGQGRDRLVVAEGPADRIPTLSWCPHSPAVKSRLPGDVHPVGEVVISEVVISMRPVSVFADDPGCEIGQLEADLRGRGR